MRPRTAAKMLALTGLLMMSCGDSEGPASPTPTPTPTPTRQLQELTWECDREATTVGVDLHCHATGSYNTEPQEASLTSSLTDSMVHTSDANVLSPGGYRDDLDGQPFVVEAKGAGQAEVWVTFDEHTSNRWKVTVNAVRELMGVEWTCDRRKAKPGEDIHCQGTAHYSEDPRQVRITDQLSRDTVQTTDASVLQPQEYRADLEGAPFVVGAAGAGEAATWIEFKGRASDRWTVTVRATPPTEERWRGIRVAPEAGRSGYERPSWEVRDTDIYRQDGSPACTPYTRTPITTVGPGDGLDREHIVALAEAWDSRPPGFQRSTLRRIAEDHDNLTLATASANRSKSDRDTAEWRPEYNGAWMAHRVVEVKREYDLSVDPGERDWLERLLGSGPDEITCGQAGSADLDHPPVRTYRNCAAMRDAGWNRGVDRNGGTYRAAWDEVEKDTYALNTARDRDRDGHACE